MRMRLVGLLVVLAVCLLWVVDCQVYLLYSRRLGVGEALETANWTKVESGGKIVLRNTFFFFGIPFRAVQVEQMGSLAFGPSSKLEKGNFTLDSKVFGRVSPFFHEDFEADDGSLWKTELEDRVVFRFDHLTKKNDAVGNTWSFAIHILNDHRIFFTYGELADNRPEFAGLRAPLPLNATDMVSGGADYNTTWRGLYVSRDKIVSNEMLEFCPQNVLVCVTPLHGPVGGNIRVDVAAVENSCFRSLGNTIQCRFGSQLSGFSSFDSDRGTLVCTAPPGADVGPVELTLEWNGVTLPLTGSRNEPIFFNYMADPGVLEGSTIVQLCNSCSHFLQPSVCRLDCEGAWNGEALFDACNECRHNQSTEALFNSSLDCQGRCYGGALFNSSLSSCSCSDQSVCQLVPLQQEIPLRLDFVQVYQCLVASSVGLLIFVHLLISGAELLKRPKRPKRPNLPQVEGDEHRLGKTSWSLEEEPLSLVLNLQSRQPVGMELDGLEDATVDEKKYTDEL